MSREIKFRAWDKHNKIMWPIKTLHFNQETGTLELLGFSYRGACFEPREDKNILMQFTGLHDKNGKEIWEGDIVEIEGKELASVVFEVGAFALTNKLSERLSNFYTDFSNRTLEVLGNIYENPELLRAEKKEG